MFNIIIRRAVAATAGAGIALTLMAAPASAAPRADGGEGQGHPAAHAQEARAEKSDRDGTTSTTDSDSAPNKGNPSDAKNECSPMHHSETGHGANQGSMYDNTCEVEHEPGNGSETGQAKGQPCAGCVGNADDKNPPGQSKVGPGGADHNAGYECDRNQGVGKENPAHTGCQPTTSETPTTQPESKNETKSTPKPEPKTQPEVAGENHEKSLECGDEMATDVNGDGKVDAEDCTEETPVKCGEVMATDVNGDGKIDATDCTKVLGVVFERPAAAPAVAAVEAASLAKKPGAQVLGVQFDRAPSVMARTGATFAPLVLAALVLIITGFGMVHGRRRSTN